jgi:hypothetical protein
LLAGFEGRRDGAGGGEEQEDGGVELHDDLIEVI